MVQINDILSLGRGYGIRMQLYYQDCGQLLKCWPDGADQTLLANTTQVFFGVNDQQTAEYVSSRPGRKNHHRHPRRQVRGWRHRQPASGKDGNHSTRASSTNNSYNWSQSARKLLKPEGGHGVRPTHCVHGLPPGVPHNLHNPLLRGDFTQITRQRAREGGGRYHLPVPAWQQMLAFITTGIYLKEGNHVRGIEGVFRAGQAAFNGAYRSIGGGYQSDSSWPVAEQDTE